jgi:hypothetical protein
MFLPTYPEFEISTGVLFEQEELTCQVDAPTAILLFVLWPTTPFLEEVLVRLIPVGNRVSQQDTGAIIQPRGLFFAFILAIGLVNWGVIPLAC